MRATLSSVPRPSTTRRLSRTVGSSTTSRHAEHAAIASATSSGAVAVTASTVGPPSVSSARSSRSVRRPVSRARQADVVRLVDHHEADAPAFGEARRVMVEELGRGQHHVERAVRERRERRVAPAGRGLAGEGRDRAAERRERVLEMERLIGHERPQRVDEDGGPPGSDRLASRVHVEDERLAAPGGHHRERRGARGEMRERLGLGRDAAVAPR